ncbi:MAG: CoA transferase [Gammaproteobacteria bacterium]
MNYQHSENHSVCVAELVSIHHDIGTAYAGWLFVQLGASVRQIVVVEPPVNDTPSPEQNTCQVLAEGKHHTVCPGTAGEFIELIRSDDILLLASEEQLSPLGLSISRLRIELPGLIIAIASTFGHEGPYANHPGTGLDAQALSAACWALGDAERKPLSLPPGIVEHEAGVMLAAGALMALHVRDATGRGRVVDIALADVLASYVGGNCRIYIRHGLRWHRSGRRASGSGGAYPFVILPCKDGEVCVFGRTPEEWQRLIKVMGKPWWADDPRYQDLRAMGQEFPDESDELIKPWLAERTKAELESIALENNLILSPLRNFDDVLKISQFAERNFFYDGEVKNKKIKLPGLPFHVREARDPQAPNISNQLLCGRAAKPTVSETPSQPLAGVRVLDFGWVWSAPWVSGMLGELGAEVIKVEHAGRPDNLRLSGRVIRDGVKVDGPSKEMSPMFHQVNHGKLGITLNLKKPRAVELCKRLAAVSDVVIENMSPGTMERSELGFDALRAVNKRIVMLSMSAAGQFGPLAKMRAYAPNMSSAAGMEALVGYRGEGPIGALNFALGDPNASTHALLAVLASLRRARLTGSGAHIDLSQVEALLGVLRPYVVDSQLTGHQSPPLGNSHPTMAPHGIFPAAGEDAWLTISTPNEQTWTALQKIAGNAPWVDKAEYATMALRLQHLDALENDIASWTETHPRDALVQQLRDAGVASTPVLSVEEQWRHPHFAARGIQHTVTIPHYGEEPIFQAPWHFSDFSPQIDTCGPATGQHNNQVLGQLLGLSEHEIDDLKRDGVVA